MHRIARSISISGMLLLCAACNSEPEPELAAAPAPAAAPKAEVAAAPANDATMKMARAVGDGKPGAAVDIRYEIGQKPEVGKPTQVDIAFIPNVGVESLDATMTGMDGITIAGNLKPHFENVEAGKPYQHTFSLLPDRAGVYYVTVAVTTTMSGASVGRTFSIPFVVGTPEVQKKVAAPAKDSSGQVVESMKAVETQG